jgi:hypothetical protein
MKLDGCRSSESKKQTHKKAGSTLELHRHDQIVLPSHAAHQAHQLKSASVRCRRLMNEVARTALKCGLLTPQNVSD